MGSPQNCTTPTAEFRIFRLVGFSLKNNCYSYVLVIMSNTVKSLTVNYNPASNEQNTFTSGDCVSGEVTLEVAKECKINSLLIQFKGKARVLWSERIGQVTVTYYSKDKYFSIKHYFLWDKDSGDDNETLLTNQLGNPYSNVVAPGSHVYPFSFQIPPQDLPSSFDGAFGKIVYALKAKLSRSMRAPTKDSTKINFVTKADLTGDPGLMEPQHESKDKKMKFFNSGTVAMDVNLEKTGFFQGEGLKVMAYIQNNSSREIKPKYCVYRKHSFFAQGKRRVSTKDLYKEVGEPIPPSSNQNVTRVLSIPLDVESSILNCSILKAEHRLRVYLDVKYASDPVIKFPIVILPAPMVPGVEAPPLAASGFGFEPYGKTYPPSWEMVPPQPPSAPQPSAPQPSAPQPSAPQPSDPQPSDPPPAYGTWDAPSFDTCRSWK